MGLRIALPFCCLLACAQDFSNTGIESVAVKLRYAEGPTWTPENILVFTDGPTNRVMRWVPGEGAQVHRENTSGAAGTALDAQGRLYICESGARRVIRVDKKNRVEVLAEKWEGKRLNAPNDIVVRKDGHVWFTDPAFGSAVAERELDFWGVYHITPKGILSLVAKWKGRPNGVTLSADGRLLFVTDSDERAVRAWDVDKNGVATNLHTVVSNIPGVPGGLRADENGNLYVAAKYLMVYSPQGTEIHRFELAEIPSNCTFGDPDYEALYVTAQTAVYRIRINVKGAVQH